MSPETTRKTAERTDRLLKELQEKSRLQHDELRQRIEEKQGKFGGMLTTEGAAHLVAKDVGIKLLDGQVKRLEMRNIVAGMRSVNAVGKIFKISGIVDFTRGGKPGRVVNVYIGDATGFVRMPLWNDQVKLVEDEQIKVGDVVQVMNAFAREGMFGVELNLGKYGRLAPLEEEEEIEGEIELPDASELEKRFLSPDARRERVAIKDAVPGNFETRAFIVQVFKSYIFYTCPECGGKVSESTGKESDGKYTCEMHGEVEAEPALVLSAIADDGTGSIRATFFRTTAEQICGLSAQEVAAMNADESYARISDSIVGREFILEGRVQRNQQFDRTEMIVNSMEQIDISGEAEKLIGALQVKIGEASNAGDGE